MTNDVFWTMPVMILGLLSIVFGFVGRYMKLIGKKEQENCTTPVEAEVIGETHESEGGWAPVVRFTDLSGNVVEGCSGLYRSGFRVPHYANGTKLTVKYDPLDSSKFVIPAFDVNAALLVGDIFVVVGYILMGALFIVVMAHRGFFG
ncbi:MAG: DUF3592 domain-containing protein [Solobacterium sp.]|nr:DUF3592 domain-containing protein [Solobacterium sp.]